VIIKSSQIKKNIFKYKCIILHGENLSLKKEIEDELLIDYKKNGYSTKIYREEELKKIKSYFETGKNVSDEVINLNKVKTKSSSKKIAEKVKIKYFANRLIRKS